MRPFWFGNYFSLWQEPDHLLKPCFRIGGPEAGGVRFEGPESWIPGEDGLYLAIFDGLASRLRSDLFLSVLDLEDWPRMTQTLAPLETAAVPLEWDDHEFHVLDELEFDSGEPTTFCTVCFSAPSRDLRQALQWVWSSQSQSCFPLLALLPTTRYLLTRLRPQETERRDARDFILDRYSGLLYVGCPREVYVAGDPQIIEQTIQTLKAIERSLAAHPWFTHASHKLLCSWAGTYYREDDPRAQKDEILGRLFEVAASAMQRG